MGTSWKWGCYCLSGLFLNPSKWIAFTQIIHWKCCMEFWKDTLKILPIHYNAESATCNNIFKCREELPALCFLVLSGSSWSSKHCDRHSFFRCTIGIAEKDGRLLPGDRLMFVNDVNLENSSLEEAVQALKGAPSGTVRIGVVSLHLSVRIQILLIFFLFINIVTFSLFASGIFLIESWLAILFPSAWLLAPYECKNLILINIFKGSERNSQEVQK